METIAVYWEPIIRVYGFEIIPEASLLRITLPLEELGFLGQHITQLQSSETSFLLAMFQYIDSRYGEMCCVVKQEHADTCRSLLEKSLKNHAGWSMESIPAVESLFFHGPHFQDRYGIIDAAMQVLTEHDIEVLAAGCAGTSIYLITPCGAAIAAKTLLAEAFTIPQHTTPSAK